MNDAVAVDGAIAPPEVLPPSTTSSYGGDTAERVKRRSYQDAQFLLDTICVDMEQRGSMNTLTNWISLAGIDMSDLNAIGVIHITGSKGKGSVSSYTNSILRQVAPDAKIGMFTSPELITSRERFLLNGALITEEDFASTFFDIWDALAKYDRTDRPIQRPGWWWYICMMAFHYYVKKEVDCLILEVGIGGRYDATNEVLFPLVTAVTHLALEHTDILGNTIEDIAYAKAGIFKPGAAALTVRQDPKAELVLQRQALIRGAPTFTVVPPMSILEDVRLGLSGDLSIRQTNASLAVAVAKAFLLSPRLTRAFLPYVEVQEREYIANLQAGALSESSDVYTARAYPGTYEQLLSVGILGWIAFIAYPYILHFTSLFPALTVPGSVSLALSGTGLGSLTLTISKQWILIGLAVLAGNLTFPLLFRPAKRIAQTVVQESLSSAVISPVDLPEAFYRGLALAYLPGRGQIEQDVRNGVTWFLDGSHTVDSIRGTAKWYRELVEQRPSKRNILLFGLTGDRSADNLLKPIFDVLIRPEAVAFNKVVICSKVRFKKDWTEWHDMVTQEQIAQAWRKEEDKLKRKVKLEIHQTVEDAVAAIKQGSIGVNDTAVLVCGSMHIVGGVMAIADLPVRFER